jgi:hypothetical protein
VTPEQTRIVAEAQRWIVYGLREVGTTRVRYVGFTTRRTRRLWEHRNGPRRKPTHPLYCWVASIHARDGEIEMTVLESGAGSDQCRVAEMKWISHFGRDALFNATDGGDSAVPIPAESRRRAGEKLKGRIFTPEHCARIADSKRGKHRPDAAAYLRRHMDGLTSEQLSEAGRRARAAVTPEGEEKIRQNSKVSTTLRWARLTVRERAEISDRASEQMKRVWARRKAAK